MLTVSLSLMFGNRKCIYYKQQNNQPIRNDGRKQPTNQKRCYKTTNQSEMISQNKQPIRKDVRKQPTNKKRCYKTTNQSGMMLKATDRHTIRNAF